MKYVLYKEKQGCAKYKQEVSPEYKTKVILGGEYLWVPYG